MTLCKAVKVDMEYVYAVWPTIIAMTHTIVKIGCWKGSLEKLRSRYVTYYGKTVGMMVFQCNDDRYAQERSLHRKLREFHIENELFTGDCIPLIPALMHDVVSDHVVYHAHNRMRIPKRPREDAEDQCTRTLQCMLYDKLTLAKHNIRLSDEVHLRATLLQEIVGVLGFRSPFDTEHRVFGYDKYKVALLQTQLFSEYDRYIGLFDKRANANKEWSNKGITDTLNIFFKNIGIRYQSLMKQQQVNKIKRRFYQYHLNADDVQRMMSSSKL